MSLHALARPWARAEERRKQKQIKRHGANTACNKRNAGSLGKINRIMDYLASLSQIWYAQSLLWLARRRRPDGGSCGLTIRHRVTSARLRPRFRRGAGRKHFRRAAHSTVALNLERRPPNFGACATVGCNWTLAEHQPWHQEGREAKMLRKTPINNVSEVPGTLRLSATEKDATLMFCGPEGAQEEKLFMPLFSDHDTFCHSWVLYYRRIDAINTQHSSPKGRIRVPYCISTVKNEKENKNRKNAFS